MIEFEKITPPQPISYPQNEAIKRMYRIPLLLFRLGLNKIYAKYILILSTYGRKTGHIHRTPLEYFHHGGQFYVMSGFGTKPDWFKNLQSDPHTTIQTKQGILHAIARKPDTEREWDAVVAYLKSSPVSKLTEHNLLNNLDKPEMRQAIKSWPVFTFDPTEETCPAPLETDLLWSWPLILLGGAGLAIIIGWLSHSKE